MRVFLIEPPDNLFDQIAAEDDLVLVGLASTAAEALEALPSAEADVVVMDVRLPDANGVELCQEIRARHPDVRLLLLTPYEDDEALTGAVSAGASGCMLRDTPPAELVEAIRDVGRGDTLIDLTLVKRARAQPDAADPDLPTEPLDEAFLAAPRHTPQEPRPVEEDFAPSETVLPRGRWPVPYVLAVIAGVAAVVLLFINTSPGTKTSRTAAQRRISARAKPTTVVTHPPETAPPTTPTTTVSSAATSTDQADVAPPRRPAPSNTASEPRFTFSYAWAECEGGRLQVAGSALNNGSSAYSVSFDVTVISASGSPQGTGSASLSRVAPGERRSFTASGSCSGRLAPGISPSTHIDSVTPA